MCTTQSRSLDRCVILKNNCPELPEREMKLEVKARRFPRALEDSQKCPRSNATHRHAALMVEHKSQRCRHIKRWLEVPIVILCVLKYSINILGRLSRNNRQRIISLSSFLRGRMFTYGFLYRCKLNFYSFLL